MRIRALALPAVISDVRCEGRDQWPTNFRGSFVRPLSIALSTVLIISLGHVPAAFAADIHIVSDGPGSQAIIDIKGEIARGDADRFYELARTAPKAMVFLHSPGGLVDEGLSIGAEIAQRGFTTVAGPDSECHSVCALIWVSGATRIMDRSANIGVHAAWRDQAMKDGTTMSVESGMANAEIGSYLTHLGLSVEAIRYFTAAGPDEVLPITPSIAQRLDIDATVMEGNDIQWARDRPSPRRLANQTSTYIGMASECSELFNLDADYLKEKGAQRLRTGHDLFGGEIFASLIPEFIDTQKSAMATMGIKDWCMAAAQSLRQDSLPIGISGPSYDCGKASTSTERAICADQNLWLEDRALGSIYTLLRNAGTPEEKSYMSKKQHKWIIQRDSCGADTACIMDRYHAWFLDLSRIAAEAG